MPPFPGTERVAVSFFRQGSCHTSSTVSRRGETAREKTHRSLIPERNETAAIRFDVACDCFSQRLFAPPEIVEQSAPLLVDFARNCSVRPVNTLMTALVSLSLHDFD